MQGPLSGLVLVLELTRNFDALMVPTLIAVIEATVIARRFGAPSIYSARMRLEPSMAAVSSVAAIETLDHLDLTAEEAVDPAPENDDGRPPEGTAAA